MGCKEYASRTGVVEQISIFPSDFIFTIYTGYSSSPGSDNKSFILPCYGSGYDASVYWGDGSSEHISGSPGDVLHTYSNTGVYQITIAGDFPRIYFNNRTEADKMISLDNWGDTIWSSFYMAFTFCINMEGKYGDSPNLSSVTSLYNMFQRCKIFNHNVNFDTSNITNMEAMFTGCDSFNKSVNSFNTSNVTTMKDMFKSCDSFNKSVSNFDTSKVTDMSGMFESCSSFKQSLASFNVTSCTTMSRMLIFTDINETGTTTNYDNTLISWASQSVKPNVYFHGGYAQYSDAGQTARNILTGAPNNWTITDGGHI